ncbi:MAG TPA: D-hexose-6-phosphate mutarotase [Longimicrobiaceae bacterium]|nr:D-hexose-6-phosphate mutarotase [Longimicrobiaceae bacterium]
MNASSDLPRVDLAHASGARAAVYLQGAHVASWTDAAGTELLFVSARSKFEPGAAIRGGIPVIFPQFADQGPLPKHGFARTAAWEHVESGTDPGGSAWALLRLADTDAMRALWPHAFRAELRVTLDAGSLAVALRVANTGDGVMAFTCALHTYFRVDDVRRAAVEGLRGVRYLDKLEAGAALTEEREAVDFAGEADRVYVAAPDRLRVRGGASGRAVVVEKQGFRDAVVWNPWEEGARGLPDMADDEYLRMLCVEPANAAEPVHLAPGEEWTGTQRLRVEADG